MCRTVAVLPFPAVAHRRGVLLLAVLLLLGQGCARQVVECPELGKLDGAPTVRSSAGVTTTAEGISKMKRYRYGVNHQTVNMADIPHLFPLGYVEVAPGETIQGSVACKLTSDVTTRAIYSRGYLDLASFYVPFRLLWEGFPEFISNGTGTVPTVADAMPLNFEPIAVAHNAWFRRAYNLIWNQFYRPSSITLVASEDQNGELSGSFRKSDWYSSLNSGALYDETDVPLVEGTPNTVTVNTIRRAFATDRLNRLRAWYGSKYTDYLASIGVEANWAILEEPECIGKKAADLRYSTTKSTYQAAEPVAGGASPLGGPGGSFDAFASCPVKRTFCPEHGLIAVMGLVRLERYNSAAQSPTNIKNSREQYWDPMFEQASRAAWTSSAVLGAGATEPIRMPPFEDYRKGVNLVAAKTGADLSLAYANVFTSALMSTGEYLTPGPEHYDALFQGDLGAHVQTVNTWRLIRNSPVRPDPRYGVP